MDTKQLYLNGKKFYNNDKHEDKLEDLYIAIDDLLDNLDDKRMEIKLLIEEKEGIEGEGSEGKIKKLYKELSGIAEKLEGVDRSESEKMEKEMEIFKAKNKYKFMQLETAEQKYANAIEKKKSEKDLAPMLENLKRLRLNNLGLQKELKRYQERVNIAKGESIKLEARRELILRQISTEQREIHKNTTGSDKQVDDLKKILIHKKSELDTIKTQIKRKFIEIGLKAHKDGLK